MREDHVQDEFDQCLARRFKIKRLSRYSRPQGAFERQTHGTRHACNIGEHSGLDGLPEMRRVVEREYVGEAGVAAAGDMMCPEVGDGARKAGDGNTGLRRDGRQVDGRFMCLSQRRQAGENRSLEKLGTYFGIERVDSPLNLFSIHPK